MHSARVQFDKPFRHLPAALRCAAAAAVWLLLSLGSGWAAENRLALVIGNGGYEDARLNNPVNDAKLIADNLESLGFRVFRHADLDQRGLRRAVSDFGLAVEEAGEQTVSLVYYAGHGVQIEGENYLVPVGAQIRHERDVPIEAVSANDILNSLGHARTRLNIVVLDACRNNPYARSFRSGTRGLARMDAPQGTLLAYSTSPGATASDGDGRNSPYALSLARAMNQPGLSIEEVFKRTRIAVMERTNDDQVPWESSSLTGYFTFMEGEGENVPGQAGAPIQAGAPMDDEIVFWTSIATSDDPALFESYLTQYPSGRFRTIAEARIAALETAPQESAAAYPGAAPIGRLAFAQGEFKPAEVSGQTECGRISFRPVRFTDPAEGNGRWSHPEASGNIQFRVEDGGVSARLSGPLIVNASDKVEVDGDDLLVSFAVTYTGGRCNLAFRMVDVIAR